jgi:chromosome partitioning protein
MQVRVVVIDTDPQKSATVFCGALAGNSYCCVGSRHRYLGLMLESADQEHMTLAIIDTAPHAAPGATR